MASAFSAYMDLQGNPILTVTLTQPSVPTFFAKIWGHSITILPGGSGGGSAGSGGGISSATAATGSGGTITQTWEPRIVQFGLKIIY